MFWNTVISYYPPVCTWSNLLVVLYLWPKWVTRKWIGGRLAWGRWMLEKNLGNNLLSQWQSLRYLWKEYIFLQGILERNVFEDEQNFPRDNFSLSAIISKLSAERSEARHSWWSRKGKSWPKESFVRPRKQFPFAVYPRGIHFLALQGVVHHPSKNW